MKNTGATDSMKNLPLWWFRKRSQIIHPLGQKYPQDGNKICLLTFQRSAGDVKIGHDDQSESSSRDHEYTVHIIRAVRAAVAWTFSWFPLIVLTWPDGPGGRCLCVVRRRVTDEGVVDGADGDAVLLHFSSQAVKKSLNCVFRGCIWKNTQSENTLMTLHSW